MATPSPNSPAPAPGKRRLRRALRFASPFRKSVTAIFVITLLLAAINAAEPLILKYIFDNLAPKSSTHVLFVGIWLLIGIGVFREIATAFSNWLTWHARLGIHYTLLENTVERLHRMPLSFHRAEGVGAIMTKLDRGIQGFINGITQILFNIFPAVLYLGISLAVMFNLNW
ncbi:MAG TPA: ABC transporter transmembrane domain-containing protein, partial [Verrucomicrobiae bacterium]